MNADNAIELKELAERFPFFSPVDSEDPSPEEDANLARLLEVTKYSISQVFALLLDVF